jgi:hypothetical protein
MINPETQLCTAERMGAHVRTRPVDHTPLVTAPADVVDIIVDAVGEVPATTWRLGRAYPPTRRTCGRRTAHGARLESI